MTPDTPRRVPVRDLRRPSRHPFSGTLIQGVERVRSSYRLFKLEVLFVCESEVNQGRLRVRRDSI